MADSRPLGRLERLVHERAARDHLLAYPRGTPTNPRHTKHPTGFWFDAEAAERPITFLETLCKHHKGEWAGRPLLLEPWQRLNIREMFGWMRRDGTRRFRVVYWEVPRKNGKSEIAAGLGLFLLVADNEPGAEVYATATKKDQAKIVHDTATAMVKRSTELRRFIGAARNNLHCTQLGSKFEPLGADSSTLDGLNPHGNLVDELHAHRDRTLWDVMDTAMGARRQPMTLAITTAGLYEPESIGWQQHQHAVHVLEGTVEDDAFFAYVAAADPEDDWLDPATWWKANPNLGVSVKREYMQAQAEKAQQQPSFLNTFLRLHLDRWTQQVDRWIRIEDWNACDVECTPAEARARETALEGEVCYAALDLSSTTDLTALVLWFPETRDLVGRIYAPAEKLLARQRKDRVPYDAWVRDGWLTATPGNVVDYDVTREDLRQLGERFRILEVAYDPWNATQLATQLGGEGFTMVEVRQGYRTLSEPSKAFEALVVDHAIRHMGNPVLRWMVANVALAEDPAGNIKPDKSGSTDRIDGVVATIMAISRAITEAVTTGVYEERGFLVLGDD